MSLEPQFWDDEKVLALSDPAQLLFAYLFTCSNAKACPGLIVGGVWSLAEARRKTPEETRAALEELERQGMAVVDQAHRVIRIPNAPRYAPCSNGNVVKGWFRGWKRIPESPLKYQHLFSLHAAVAKRTANHHRAWNATFGTITGTSQTVPETLPQTIMEGFDKPFVKQTLPLPLPLPLLFPDPEGDARGGTHGEKNDEPANGTGPPPDWPPQPREFFPAMAEASRGALTAKGFSKALVTPYQEIMRELWADGYRMADCLRAAKHLRNWMPEASLPLGPKWLVKGGNLADAIGRAEAKGNTRARASPTAAPMKPREHFASLAETTREALAEHATDPAK